MRTSAVQTRSSSGLAREPTNGYPASREVAVQLISALFKRRDREYNNTAPNNKKQGTFRDANTYIQMPGKNEYNGKRPLQ